MIKFSGEYCKTSRNYLIKTSYDLLVKIILVVSAMLFAVMLFFSSQLETWLLMLYPALVLVFSLLSAYIYFHSEGSKNRLIKDMTPVYITIDDDGYLEQKRPKDSQIAFVDDVKSVTDYGDFYIVLFAVPIGLYVLCEKDLIVTGTIEEFEKLFEGKIVKKDSDITE